MWIERLIKEDLIKSADTRPVVLLTGARQTGKSSLLKKHFKKAVYITFDHLNQANSAKANPIYFLNNLKNQTILDEVQYVPEIFRELKIEVDVNRTKYGKWLLTGSQQFELMTNLSESLAGRISILHLETLSAKELRASKIKSYKDTLIKGGYPELWSNPKIDISNFFESYIRTYIERDLKSIVEVKNLSDFRRFLEVLSSRVGQLINFTDISKDVGVSDPTIKKWVHALEISGLIYLVPPFFENIGKRLTKTPKLYFADQGLVTYLLGIENLKDWQSHIHKGNLWENFVFTELVKTNFLKPGKNIFFYRDQNAVEVDFIVKNKKYLIFIEAKASENIDSNKLNFKTVLPLFQKKHKTVSLVLNNLKTVKPLMFKNFLAINPLLTDLNLKELDKHFFDISST